MKTPARLSRWLVFVGMVACSIWGLGARAKNFNPPAFKPSIELSPIPADATKRSITLEDMLSLREVHEPRQSPDGQRVAFLVRQAFRKCDCYRTAVYLADARKNAPATKLVEEDYLASLQWTPDGQSISFLSSHGGSVQLWRLNIATKRSDRVFLHRPNSDVTADRAFIQSAYLPASGVLDYRWSPDGRLIVFTAEAPLDPSLAADAAKKGFLYDDTKMDAADLVAGDWVSGHRSKQLWLYDVRRQHEIAVWAAPTAWSTEVTSLLWAPSSRKLLFSYSRDTGFGADGLAILDAATSTVTEMGAAVGTIGSAGTAWSTDEEHIAYLARVHSSSFNALVTINLLNGSAKELSRSIFCGHFPWLSWDEDHHKLKFLSEGLGNDRQMTGIYVIRDSGGEPLRLTDLTGKVDECDTAIQGAASCVWQSPSIPPRPALVATTDGKVRSLMDINPEIGAVELAPVREMRWNNVYDTQTNGFLILPKNRISGQRVPLVVIGYSFSGEFVTQANKVLTTYPAQAFARDGIAVLLFNYPRYDDWEGPNFARGSKALGYGPLSSIESVIEQLDAEGLIDPQRVGMMGHSLAGFWVQLAITQTNLFKAVEMHNGGTVSEPGTYWVSGSAAARALQEHIMGGPPYGLTLKNYLGFSMSLNADKIHAPVLMEYEPLGALSALEYYEAMQHYGVPLDLYIYPGDGHSTERPEHRIMSMQRNLDWFEFWLLGKENDASTKQEQYSRWRDFKTKLTATATLSQSN